MINPNLQKSIAAHTTYKGVSHLSRGPILEQPMRTDQRFTLMQSGRDQRLVSMLGWTITNPVLAQFADLLPLYQYFQRLPIGRCYGPTPLLVEGINTSTEVLTITDHGMSTGDTGMLSWDETAPTLGSGSLLEQTLYYFSAPSSSTLKVFTNDTDAQAGTNALNFSAAGTGDFYVHRQFPLKVDRRTNVRRTYTNAVVIGLPDLVCSGGQLLFEGNLVFRGLPALNSSPDGSDDTDAFYSEASQNYSLPTWNGNETLTKIVAAAWGGSSPWSAFRSVSGFRASFELQFDDMGDGVWPGATLLFKGCKVTIKATPIGLTVPQYQAAMAAPLGTLLDGADLVLTGTSFVLTGKQAILEPQATRYDGATGLVQELTWTAEGQAASDFRVPFTMATS